MVRFHHLTADERESVKARQIICDVAREHGLDLDLLRCRSRRAHLVVASRGASHVAAAPGRDAPPSGDDTGPGPLSSGEPGVVPGGNHQPTRADVDQLEGKSGQGRDSSSPAAGVDTQLRSAYDPWSDA